ncbi:MAG: hypothetical protein K6F98_09700 [Bacteroidales bacterium]|nr:hypothetical protein [Bacteroidales bacterium]
MRLQIDDAPAAELAQALLPSLSTGLTLGLRPTSSLPRLRRNWHETPHPSLSRD